MGSLWDSFKQMFRASGAGRRSAVIEAIETRQLFSADPAGVMPPPDPQGTVNQPVSPPLTANVSTQQVNSTPHELVLIDSNTPQIELLLADLQSQLDQGRSISWEVIGPQQNGVDAITRALSEASRPVDAVHIVGHGEGGYARLGATLLDNAAIRASATDISQWATYLSADADLLFYGCDLAASETGQTLLQTLAQLSGADTAASTDATGAAWLGGNWQLEFRTGQIDTALAFSESTEQTFGHILENPFVGTPGAEIQVNTNTTNAQELSGDSGGRQVAVNDSGITAVVWEDKDDKDVKLRIFAADGSAITGEILVNSASTGFDASQPAVAINQNGTIVVLWTSHDQDGSGDGIYGRIFDAGGGTTVSEFLLNNVTAEDQTRPDVAIASDGSFVATWTRYFAANNTEGVQARLFNANGTAKATEFAVNVSGANDQSHSSIAMDGMGNFVITWQSEEQDGSGLGVYMRRFDGTGLALNLNDVLVNTNTSGDQFDPSVAMNASGQFVVSWTTLHSGSGDGVAFQRFDASGSKLGTQTPVNENFAGNQNQTSAVMFDDGSVAFAFRTDAATAGTDIMVRRFDASGAPEATEQVLNQYTSGDQANISLATAGSYIVAAWSGQSASDTEGVVLRQDFLITSVTPGSILVSAESTVVTESGTTATLNVQLSSAPLTNVQVTVSLSDASEGSLSQTLLTFTPTNWNVAQPVIVSGVNDTHIDGTKAFEVSFTAASLSPGYLVVAPVTVNLTNGDDDTFNLIMVDTTADTADGDTSSIEALMNNRGIDGRVSLREAILAANNTANGATAVDQIRFDFGALGGDSIALVNALPAITDAVLLEGSNPAAGMLGNGTRAPAITIRGNLADTSHALIELADTASGSTIRGLALGNTTGDAIWVRGDGNLIEANYIGVAADGVSTLSVGGNGVCLDGGGDGNVIRTNTILGSQHGIFLDGNQGTLIEGNTLGWLGSTNSVVGFSADAIRLQNGASASVIRGNTIGGAQKAAVVLSGATTTDNSIQGNWIGTTAAGTDIARGDDGVAIEASASGNTVGGVATGEGNIIRNHDHYGVAVFNMTTGDAMPVDNSILGNVIDGNTLGGIFIQKTGGQWTQADRNDTNDADGGANRGQNAPSLSRAQADRTAGTLTLTGTLRGVAGTSYRLEFFSDTTPHSVGAGEADTFLGHHHLVMESDGSTSFTVTFTSGLADGVRISATATVADAGFTNFGDSSAFSNGTPVRSDFPPSIVTAGTIVSVAENTAGTLLTIVTSDPDTSAENLTYSIVPNQHSGYLFAVDPITGALSFTNPQDFENPLDTNNDNLAAVIIRVTDPEGNSATRTFTIRTTDVNEPYIISTPAMLNMTEDTPATIGELVNNQLVLTDQDAGAQIRVTIIPTKVTVDAAQIPGVTTTTNGASVTLFGAVAEVRAALGALTLTPDAHYAGAAGLTVLVVDPTGVHPPSSQRIDIDIAAVNDLPEVEAITSTNISANTRVAITSAMLSATDVDNTAAELRYVIRQVPTGGQFVLDGDTLLVGDSFTQRDIDGNRLEYRQASSPTSTQQVSLALYDGDRSEPVVIDIQMRIAGQVSNSGTTSRPSTSNSGNSSTDSGSAGSSSSTSSSTGNGTNTGTNVTANASANTATAPAAALVAGPTPSGAKAAGPGNGPANDTAPLLASLSASAGSAGTQTGARDASLVADRARAVSLMFGDASTRVRLADSIRVDTVPSGVERRVFNEATYTPIRQALKAKPFTEELSKVRERAQEQVQVERVIVASSAAVSASLSIGYVIWLLRGGVLLSSLLATLPAWRSIDPLPMLQNLSGGKDNNDDDSLEGLLEKARNKALMVHEPPAEPPGPPRHETT